MKNSETPIHPLILRQTGENEFKVATEKDQREGIFLSSSYGLTKREYFAALAMQGLLANPNIKRPEQNANLKNDLKIFSSIAIEYADSILSELSKSDG